MIEPLLIKKISPSEAPWPLLLLADPERKQVEKYLYDGDCYVAVRNDQTIGVLVLLETDSATLEIKNIAVEEDLQGQEIGKRLIAEAVSIAKQRGMSRLEVGTGNSSIDELAFYQIVGFRIVGVDRDFFVRNYAEEIIENGIRCVDMIRLEMEVA